MPPKKKCAKTHDDYDVIQLPGEIKGGGCRTTSSTAELGRRQMPGGKQAIATATGTPESYARSRRCGSTRSSVKENSVSGRSCTQKPSDSYARPASSAMSTSSRRSSSRLGSLARNSKYINQNSTKGEPLEDFVRPDSPAMSTSTRRSGLKRCGSARNLVNNKGNSVTGRTGTPEPSKNFAKTVSPAESTSSRLSRSKRSGTARNLYNKGNSVKGRAGTLEPSENYAKPQASPAQSKSSIRSGAIRSGAVRNQNNSGKCRITETITPDLSGNYAWQYSRALQDPTHDGVNKIDGSYPASPSKSTSSRRSRRCGSVRNVASKKKSVKGRTGTPEPTENYAKSISSIRSGSIRGGSASSLNNKVNRRTGTPEPSQNFAKPASPEMSTKSKRLGSKRCSSARNLGNENSTRGRTRTPEPSENYAKKVLPAKSTSSRISSPKRRGSARNLGTKENSLRGRTGTPEPSENYAKPSSPAKSISSMRSGSISSGRTKNLDFFKENSTRGRTGTPEPSENFAQRASPAQSTLAIRSGFRRCGSSKNLDYCKENSTRGRTGTPGPSENFAQRASPAQSTLAIRSGSRHCGSSKNLDYCKENSTRGRTGTPGPSENFAQRASPAQSTLAIRSGSRRCGSSKNLDYSKENLTRGHTGTPELSENYATPAALTRSTSSRLSGSKRTSDNKENLFKGRSANAGTLEPSDDWDQNTQKHGTTGSTNTSLLRAKTHEIISPKRAKPNKEIKKLEDQSDEKSVPFVRVAQEITSWSINPQNSFPTEKKNMPFIETQNAIPKNSMDGNYQDPENHSGMIKKSSQGTVGTVPNYHPAEQNTPGYSMTFTKVAQEIISGIHSESIFPTDENKRDQSSKNTLIRVDKSCQNRDNTVWNNHQEYPHNSAFNSQIKSQPFSMGNNTGANMAVMGGKPGTSVIRQEQPHPNTAPITQNAIYEPLNLLKHNIPNNATLQINPAFKDSNFANFPERIPRFVFDGNTINNTFNQYENNLLGNGYNDEEQKNRRIDADLALIFEGLDSQSFQEETSVEGNNQEQLSVDAKANLDEVDARLQAELDALPMVEIEAETEPPKTEAAVRIPQNTVYPMQSQQFHPPRPVAPINQMAYYNSMQAARPTGFPMVNPVATTSHRTLAQVPIVTRLKGAQGQDISVKYTTGPDGLITNVQMDPPPMGSDQSKGMAKSFTALELHQILQSGQPYLPMTSNGCPGAMLKEPLMIRDAPAVFPAEQAVEDEEVDYEEIGVADTFAAYWPSKLKVGRAHPDPVVETATLSSVELPDITYQLGLPAKTTECLSALQLEAVVYACQAHEQILPSGERAGFLLGDGAGVGKGRTIAGIIYDNYLKGRRRALWISVSNDLKFDAERDLSDIGAHEKVRVVPISKFKYSRIDSEENENFRRGVIFCTYTALIGESLTANSKYKTRLRQLVNWLGKKFDGVIVFDECHKAKNLSLMNVGKSTKTGTTVLELQKLLPNARVVYASATGASEPRNMAYMVRLGLWGPGTSYPEFYEFVNAVEKRGIGAMEIVAMDMKLRGTYIARQLSFKDVSFRIEEVPMAKDFRKSYNLAAELWAEINKKFQRACRLMCIENRVQKIITCQFWCAHQRFFKNLCIASKVNHVVKMTRQATRMGKAVVIGLQSTGESRTLEHLERHHGKLNTFVSTSKMIIQSFVEKHFPAPKRDSFHHLLNTGEFEPEARSRPPRAKKAKMNPDWFDDDMDAEAGESDIEMYESSWGADDERTKSGRKRRGRPPKADKVEKITMQERILQHLCNNMRAQDNDGEPTYTFDNTKPQKANITERDVERCISSRELLLEKIEMLGKKMPPNTLDKLISELGGTNLVAEMTGRRGRVVRTEYDGYKYEPRCENDSSMDLVNYREKQRFMEGSKHVAIISEAASSGISLQSDKRVSNQRRRLHITLELPWSADRAIQQFGRTHRSNQVNSPEYVFVITDLAGERRFASTVAKRLESLGALTQGDRRATDARDLSQFNIDNSIGRSALESVMQQLTREKPLDPSEVPQSYKGDFLFDCSASMAGVGMLNVREENKLKVFSVEKDSNNISKFLNRILGCRVEIQNALFKFFLDKMYSLIMQMKRTGRFDLGILDLDAHGASVKSIKRVKFIRKHATGTAATELHTVTVERGMSFETALAKYRKEGQHEHDGFYVLQQLRHNKNSSILCLQAQSNSSDATSGKINLQIYRPNTGPQVRLETLSSISSRYVKVEPEKAQEFWLQQYDFCLNKCSHVYWSRICPYPTSCEVGLRVRTYHVLSGLMLPIWDRIELIIEKSNQKIQIIRVKTDVNTKIVGTVVPHAVYDALVADLSSDSIMEVEDH
ncbi:protein strawberry notch homolog 1 isoform X3 [Drosophila biarmipes]|uniref:protein strawberry notch homolog 1 isoform X3 n=1 Tax=Drosophila biarmipes TaxID=125945 RepID=UPI0021CC6250|nr:protein strawberry notch homolog 1 isoform X3 [Drosophila biarmipes]